MPTNVVLLDANLLVLFVVGAASIDYIERHKRLRVYTPCNYHLLVGLLSSAASVCVAPSRVTEASNLARHIDEPARSEVSEALRTFLHGAVKPISPALGPQDPRQGRRAMNIVHHIEANR